MPAPGSGCQNIVAPSLVVDQKCFIKGNNWWEVSSEEFPVCGGESPGHCEARSSSGIAWLCSEGRSVPVALGEPGWGM